MSTLTLVLSTGCPDKSGSAPSSSRTTQNNATLQMIFDEAGKGGGASTVNLKAMYESVVVDSAKADELSEMGTKDKDRFFCRMTGVPADGNSRFVMDDFLGKVSKTVDVLNEDCDGAKKPLHLMVDASRNVQGDVADEVDAIIHTMVVKGDASTLAAADNNARIMRVLTAVLNKGDQATLNKAFADAPAGVNAHVSSWAFINRNDAKVIPAHRAKGSVSNKMIVDEVAKGPGLTNSAMLKFLFDTKVVDHVTATDLSTETATVATADRFANYLSRFPADANTLAMWNDFFTKLEAHPGNLATVTAQVNLAGAGVTPFVAMVKKRGAVGDNVGERQEILTLMVKKGDQATVRAANTNSKLTRMMNAVFTKDKPAIVPAIGHVDLGTLRAELIAWAGTTAGDATVAGAMAGIIPVVTAQNVVDEAAKGPGGTTTAALKTAYDAFVTDHATAVALSTQAGTALSADRFANYLSRFPADANTLAVWNDFFTKLEAHPGNLATVTAQVNLLGAGITPFVAMVKKRGAVGDNVGERQEILTLMVKKGDQATVRAANTNSKLTRMMNAVFTKDKPAIVPAIGHVDLGTLRAELIAWAGTTAGDATVAGAMAGIIPVVTAQNVVDEAAKGPGGTTTAALKTAYDAFVTDHATAVALSTQAGTALSADRFANYLSRFPADANTLAMWNDFFTKLGTHPGNLATVTAQVNLLGAGITPFVAMVKKRGAVGDNVGERQEILTLMVKKGDQATVRAANTNSKLTRMMNAVFTKDKPAIVPAIGHVDLGTLRAELIAWAGTTAGDATVAGAMAGIIPVVTAQNVVDEAAKGPGGTTTAALKTAYDAFVTDHATAVALSTQAGTALSADRFANYLSRFPADANTLAVWNDFFTKLEAHPGNLATVTAQVNLAGAGVTPFNAMIGNRVGIGDSAGKRQKIITLMVKKGDQATVRSATSEKRLIRVLDAVLEKGVHADMRNVFTGVDDANVAWLGNWSGRNLGLTLKADGTKLADIFQATYIARLDNGARANLRNSLVKAAYTYGKMYKGHDGTAGKEFDRGDYDTAVLTVADLITEGYFEDREAVGCIFDPFGVGGNSRLLFAVLQKVKDEITADVNIAPSTEAKYLSGVLVNGLAKPIKALFKGALLAASNGDGTHNAAAGWSNYVRSAKNHGSKAIEVHVVRESITQAVTDGVDLVTKAAAGSAKALGECATWLDV